MAPHLLRVKGLADSALVLEPIMHLTVPAVKSATATFTKLDVLEEGHLVGNGGEGVHYAVDAWSARLALARRISSLN
jgi:hypothetical protein